uniref:COMM domain-containing protein n=1 Tax=Globodera pallida TaxID=36090 RepID=A0A183BNB5_GLOPA
MEIDDQQQPSTMSAKTFMEILLNKMLEKLPKTKQHRLNVEQNVFAAWKMDVPEQRFVQSLLDYDRDNPNKMEMVLKNGFKDLLLTFQREENLCEIEIPSAIEKMKVEIDQQIKRLNKKFTLSA